MYKVVFSRQAHKDLQKLKRAGLAKQARYLTQVVTDDPYQIPPMFEKLVGDLSGYFSRRINSQHRFVYEILPNHDGMLDNNQRPYKGIVHILRMWTHYE